MTSTDILCTSPIAVNPPAATIPLVELVTAEGVPIWVSPGTAAAWLAAARERTITVSQPAPPPEPPAAPNWITVGEAARRHLADVDDLTLGTAKTKISRAASAGHIATNGEKGNARRLESDSVDAWRLAEREKELDRLS